jgi:hypothetical protein
MDAAQQRLHSQWRAWLETEQGVTLLRRPKRLARHVVLPQAGVGGGHRKHHALLALLQRSLGPPAPGHLQQQIAQYRGDRAERSERDQHGPSMLLPQRRLLEEHLRTGRKVALRKAPARELPCVDPVGVRVARAQGLCARRPAAEDIEHEIGGLGADRFERDHVSPDGPAAEQRIVGAVDRRLRGVEDLLGDVDGNEVPAGPVAEDREDDDDRVARQPRHFRQQRIARQTDQVARVEPLLVRGELGAGNLRPSLVERCGTRDHDEAASVGLQALGQRYRAGYVELADDAGRIARQIDAGERCRGDAAEHDRGVGSQKAAITGDGGEAVGAQRHHDIERRVRVLVGQVPHDALPVPLVRELGKIEEFPVRLDVRVPPLQQPLANGIAGNEGRAVDIAVGMEDEHAPRGVLRTNAGGPARQHREQYKCKGPRAHAPTAVTQSASVQHSHLPLRAIGWIEHRNKVAAVKLRRRLLVRATSANPGRMRSNPLWHKPIETRASPRDEERPTLARAPADPQSGISLRLMPINPEAARRRRHIYKSIYPMKDSGLLLRATLRGRLPGADAGARQTEVVA